MRISEDYQLKGLFYERVLQEISDSMKSASIGDIVTLSIEKTGVHHFDVVTYRPKEEIENGS